MRMTEDKDKKSLREVVREAVKEGTEKGDAIAKDRTRRMNEWSERRRAEGKHYKEDRQKIWRALRSYLKTRKRSDAMGFVDAYGHIKTHRFAWRIVLVGVVLVYGTATILLTLWGVIPTLVTVYDFTRAQAVEIGIQIEAGLLVVAAAWASAYLWGKRRGKQGTVSIDELRQLLKEDREATIQALLSDLPMGSRDTLKESPAQSQESSQASASSSPSQEQSQAQE
jgi:hypothetical protein